MNAFKNHAKQDSTPTRRPSWYRPGATALVVLLSWGQMLPAWAAPAQLPLLTRSANPATPNVVYTIDDSGSMAWRYMPDSASPVSGNDRWGLTFHPGDDTSGYTTRVFTTRVNDLLSARMRSPSFNTVYYNPEIRYEPWFNSDGTQFPNSNPLAAWRFPNDRDPVGTPAERSTAIAAGNAVNLVGEFVMTRNWCKSRNDNVANSTTVQNGTTLRCHDVTNEVFTPAVYYVHNGGSFTDATNFTRVRIMDSSSFTRGAGRTDCAVVGSTSTCTQAQEYQNFANWFTYYRTRMFLAIGATSQAFAAQGSSLRVGYAEINRGVSTIDGVATGALRRGVRTFSGADRQAFFTWLYGVAPTGSTHLRRALSYVGQYYQRADNRGPWGNTPGSDDPTAHLECRKSYHILMTDGYWNGDAASPSGARANVDNSTGPAITGPNGGSFQYTPVAPYRDSASDTLADAAMYYWNRDLRPTLDNRVSPDADNPAFWQSMVNFTVGLGLQGTLSFPDDTEALRNGSKSWPSSVPAESQQTIDDLWHAAVNSRGRYLSAKDPADFAQSLSQILQEIAQRNANDGGVATAASSLQAGNRKFVPEYRTGVWTGNLRAFELDERGQQAEQIWDAASKLPAHGSRRIFAGTRNGSPKAVEFRWSALPSAMRTEMGGSASENLVNYIRGDDSLEGSTYRKRSSRLGDFVNSQPVFVKGLVNMQYGFLPSGTPGQDSYRAFYNAKREREGVVFVGGNAGMLHGFRDGGGAAQGQEVFAFIPRALLGTLNLLSSNSYGHRYYVDGPLTESDAYWGGAWRNVLVGTTGAGARSVFALDVTAPVTMTASNVLWELDSTIDADVGHVMSAVQVGIMRDGTWAAVFGNGYDSASGKAQLFIVNMQTGAVIRKIDTGVGSGNGLSGVKLIRNENQVIVGAYAGDLKGNVWKFDLTSTSPGSWGVGFGGQPLFTATNAGVPQPITSAPDFVEHPNGGQMVILGTGKLYEEGDQNDTQVQTLYGLWDQQKLMSSGGELTWTPEPRITSATSVVAQNFSAAVITNGAGGTYYQVNTSPLDWAEHRGWSLPLTLAAGQRNVIEPLTQGLLGLALFQTVAQSGGVSVNPCIGTDGEGYNILVNPITGAMPTARVFDTNGDGLINQDDEIVVGYKTKADGRDVVLGESPGGGPSICPRGEKYVVAIGTEGAPVAQCLMIARPRVWRQIHRLPQ